MHFKGSLRTNFSPHLKTKKAIDLVSPQKDKNVLTKATFKLPPPYEIFFKASLFKQGKMFMY